MKGIILAGGYGKRLNPITFSISKHLLPIYNKPLIYYPLSILMLANIKDILLITKSEDLILFKKLLGDGSDYGIKINYAIQEKPKGIAQAFTIGENFIGSDKVCLILGDNIFWGDGLHKKLLNAKKNLNGNVIFSYNVDNPQDFAVLEKSSRGIKIIEKPKNNTNKQVVTGLYFYDNSVINLAKKIKPSSRGELEITSINNIYAKKNKTKVINLGRGFAWYDAGTFSNLLKASMFIQTIEHRQGMRIACLEEIALNKKWITLKKFKKLISKYENNEYGNYLKVLSK